MKLDNMFTAGVAASALTEAHSQLVIAVETLHGCDDQKALVQKVASMAQEVRAAAESLLQQAVKLGNDQGLLNG